MNNLYKALWFGLIMKVLNFLRSGVFLTILLTLQIVIVILKIATSIVTISWFLALSPIITYVSIIILFFAWVGYKLITGYKPKW